ncbi:hypothetical protein, partial [Streptomyces lunaelactis]|uniref:hypothetical protein n=1 Tax=Streptomyces lunaelactis TaxID=1535768 RepID=UPI003D6C8BBE
MPTKKLTIYIPDLPGSGVDRLYLSLIPFFRSRNLEVTLLLDTDYGALMNNVPQDIKIYVFREKRFTKTFPKLLRYIEKER